jgi:hypothetical protein
MVILMSYFDVMQHFSEQIFQTKIGSYTLIKWELVARHGISFKSADL